VAPATYNLRLAIVSSFYTFALRRKLLDLRENPVAQLARRSVQSYAAAVPLAPETVQVRMAAIGRTTPAGQRALGLPTSGPPRLSRADDGRRDTHRVVPSSAYA
jgi:hypothetical protein